MKLLGISPNKDVLLQPITELATRQNLVSSPTVPSGIEIYQLLNNTRMKLHHPHQPIKNPTNLITS